MKKNDRYRYTLQFPAVTEDQLQVGELLERLGSKKSKFIVMVIAEYVQTHPEIMEHKAKITVTPVNGVIYTRDDIKKLIKQIIAEGGLDNINVEAAQVDGTPNDTGIDSMLDSLGLFT